MINHIEYKGYFGTVEYCSVDDILHGEVVGIPKTLIMYHGSCLESLKRDFYEAVDFYLSNCEDKGEKPTKPHYSIATA